MSTSSRFLELIYGRLAQRDTKWYRQLFSFNPRALLSGYNRMISYWNAYYRHRWAVTGSMWDTGFTGNVSGIPVGRKTGLDRREPA